MAPLIFLLLFGQILLCAGVDTINSATPLSGSQKIVSQGSKFTLGFYSPQQVHLVPLLTPVWTAITNVLVSHPTTASLEIAKDSNLVLHDQAKNRQLWSSNVSISSNSTVVIMRDSGSLQLTDASNSSMLGLNKVTGVRKRLVCWKNSADPSPGLFFLEVDPNGMTQKWNKSVNYWTSGPWNGKYFTMMPEAVNNLYHFQVVNNATESYLSYSMKDDSLVSRFIIDMTGQTKQLIWMDSEQNWLLVWTTPQSACDVYAPCGAYGCCNPRALLYCNCVKGFSQKVQSDWDLQDYSGGCKRNAPLFCQTNSRSAHTQSDKFYVMTDVRLPDNARGAVAKSSQQCQVACLNNCSCTAYAYNHAGCIVWHGDLINLQQQYMGTGGGTLLLRLAASELPDQQRTSELPDQQSRKTRINGSVVGGVAAVLIILAIISFFLFHKCRRDKTLRISENAGAAIDSLLLDLSTLRAATNDFGEGNMLGKGGFGMVHKGVLRDGKQIAVKRLCQSSRQGIGELKSELVLVAKLRHRNLVSLIGVCLEEQEKILVYEFMPNRSLDTILFDSEKRRDLDWGSRFKIISGVARGLQYLHEDSQLKIVHRDLKASNILLDLDYNPKISDFGLAKIFGGDQSEDVTRRIAGTYFGVLVLEIVTGRRNNGSCNSEQYVYLVNLVWEHWTRGNVIELIDPSLSDHPSHVDQVLKCIQIGLLCVQNRPEDRPAMSSVNVMLSSQSARLPSVSMPGFSDGLSGRSDNNSKAASSNGMTITKLEPR
ncbi:hypothetical protein VPH35_107606 [Triticum aestivum]